MGTSEFAVPALKTLLLSGYDVPLVVTQPDRPAGRGRKPRPSPVKVVAEDFGVDIIQPVNIREQQFYDILYRMEPEVIVVVAYGKILPPEVLKIPPLGCINLHGSLLPAYRGAAPIQRAIMAGEKVVGVTTMYMDEGMDTGDLILSQAVELRGDEDYQQVAAMLSEIGANLLLETLEQVEWGIAPRIPQDNSKASYAPPLKADDELIVWERDSLAICNQVRALCPQPGSYTWWEGRKLKIFRARPVSVSGEEPGIVVDIIPGEGFVVAARDGGVLVTEVQREGSKRMAASEFLKGAKLKPGDVLGTRREKGKS